MKKKLPIKKAPDGEGEKRTMVEKRSGGAAKPQSEQVIGSAGDGNLKVKPSTHGAYERLDPERMNHLLLIQMQTHGVDKDISTCEINPLTRLSRQYYYKLRPVPGQKEVNVTFFTMIRWCNETERPIQNVVEDLVVAFRGRAN